MGLLYSYKYHYHLYLIKITYYSGGHLGLHLYTNAQGLALIRFGFSRSKLSKKSLKNYFILKSEVDLGIVVSSLDYIDPDFGLQKPTGPSSGVVASIVLVSPGLDCPGVSLAEVCATCLRCHLW